MDASNKSNNKSLTFFSILICHVAVPAKTNGDKFRSKVEIKLG